MLGKHPTTEPHFSYPFSFDLCVALYVGAWVCMRLLEHVCIYVRICALGVIAQVVLSTLSSEIGLASHWSGTGQVG